MDNLLGYFSDKDMIIRVKALHALPDENASSYTLCMLVRISNDNRLIWLKDSGYSKERIYEICTKAFHKSYTLFPQDSKYIEQWENNLASWFASKNTTDVIAVFNPEKY